MDLGLRSWKCCSQVRTKIQGDRSVDCCQVNQQGIKRNPEILHPTIHTRRTEPGMSRDILLISLHDILKTRPMQKPHDFDALLENRSCSGIGRFKRGASDGQVRCRLFPDHQPEQTLAPIRYFSGTQFITLLDPQLSFYCDGCSYKLRAVDDQL